MTSGNDFKLQQCRRLYAVPSGRRMTFVKAYEDLWNSRFTKPPIENINTFSIEELEKKVTRLWRVEHNLNCEAPTPIRYHHIQRAEYLLPWPGFGFPRPVHIVEGKYIFSRAEQNLYCYYYSQSTQLECVWCSDALSSPPDYYIRSSWYIEDGRKVLVIINLG